jgi:Asp-tRNA(Asn)/Glu-tRNA(Gln) amidotransferase B subunit
LEEGSGGRMELHNLYSSPNIVRMIKHSRMRWAEHVEYSREIRNATEFWSENVNERDHSENLGVDGRIILEWILGK